MVYRGSHILIVDDDPMMCETLEIDFRHRGYTTSWFTDVLEAHDYVKTEGFDVLLTDLKMPGMDGIQFCREVTSLRPDVPVIVFTAFGSMETAIAAIRAGAYDFVTKPVELDLLALQLERALKYRKLQQAVRLLSEAAVHQKYTGLLVGEGAAMQELYERIELLQHSDSSVLIQGESGTGKELVAKILHKQSRRNQAPFVALNCAALPDNLLESELFGHVRGAFTGAERRHKGLFEQANRGTLFLDEIAEMPLALQAKLLRALEECVVRPVGAEKEIPFDARIVAATHMDLELAVEEGRFREDLFFRLNVIQLDIPPLRSRGNDILLLAQHFLQKYASLANKDVRGFSEPVVEKLLHYPWPGNVRELRNAMEHAVVLTQHQTIFPSNLPKKVRDFQRRGLPFSPSPRQDIFPLVSLEEMEKQYVLHVFHRVKGNRTMAAKVLGVDRKTLYRKLQRYNQETE